MITSSIKNIVSILVIFLMTFSCWSQSVTTIAGTGLTTPYVNDIPGDESNLNNPTAVELILTVMCFLLIKVMLRSEE